MLHADRLRRSVPQSLAVLRHIDLLRILRTGNIHAAILIHPVVGKSILAHKGASAAHKRVPDHDRMLQTAEIGFTHLTRAAFNVIVYQTKPLVSRRQHGHRHQSAEAAIPHRHIGKRTDAEQAGADRTKHAVRFIFRQPGCLHDNMI